LTSCVHTLQATLAFRWQYCDVHCIGIEKRNVGLLLYSARHAVSEGALMVKAAFVVNIQDCRSRAPRQKLQGDSSIILSL